MMMEQITDFDSSFFTYAVRDGGNHGRFQIDSVCNVQNGSGTERFFVLHPVMACDVYGTGGLIKEPAYRFQAVFSTTQCKIFRTFLETGRRDDTSGPVDRDYSGIELRERRKDMTLLDGCGEIVRIARGSGQLVGRASFGEGSLPGIDSMTIEFPVRHINIDPVRDAFQVETGIVVLPHGTDSGLSFLDRMELHFIAFNTLTKMGVITLPLSKVRQLDCVIRLYGQDVSERRDIGVKG